LKIPHGGSSEEKCDQTIKPNETSFDISLSDWLDFFIPRDRGRESWATWRPTVQRQNMPGVML